MRPTSTRLLVILTALARYLPFASSIGVAQEPAVLEARLVVHADQPSPLRIPDFITRKFCEHLGANIYNGMDAQILRNPTFADFPFWTGQMTPDGTRCSPISGRLHATALRQSFTDTTS